ncbi:type II secretion system F family protein [Candidatus Uhrbacteria bacterium]|nr:type II secretion system F family protein [Candidatus Uhrbacteria bacterium]
MFSVLTASLIGAIWTSKIVRRIYPWASLIFTRASGVLVQISGKLRQPRQIVQINKQIPSMLDYLQMYLNAGLNIQAAFLEFSRQESTRPKAKFQTDWLIIYSLLEQGFSFEQVLPELTRRFPSPEFKRVIMSLNQSQKLGVSVSQTLAIQAEMIRGQKKRQAEEKAKSAGVKISLPVIFFIFPAILILFLGPAVLQIMDLFKN